MQLVWLLRKLNGLHNSECAVRFAIGITVPPFCVITANFSDIFYALMPITIATQQDLGKDDYMGKSNWARQAYEIAIRTAVKWHHTGHRDGPA